MAKKKYYIVNPAGAVHSAEREHAVERLRTVGWRKASAAEIREYKKCSEQRFDDPIAAPWNPELMIGEIEVDEPAAAEDGEE